MSYTNGLDKPSDYFNTVLYTGNGTLGHAITGVGHKPDFVWIKNRGSANGHVLHDVIRGVTKNIETSSAAAENTLDPLSSFDSDGFTLNGTGGGINGNTETYASWNWKAGGTAVSNTDGSITSTVSANTTSGFSIVSYTGNSTSGATVGHGLSSALGMLIVKNRSEAKNWCVFHQSNGGTKNLSLNTTDAVEVNATRWNNTAPTSSVFTLGNSTPVNNNGITYIAYCFAEKQGYSKFGSYTGNGQDTPNGVFTYLGFTPAFILIKATDINSWVMVDNKRPADSNPVDSSLAADSTATETTGDINTTFDFLSNGFRTNGNSGNNNSSGQEYIYMAFAENPFVSSSGVPATAR